MWPLSGPHVGHMWQTRGTYVGDNWPTCDNQQVQKWQSRGAYLAVNRHRSGPCVAVVQAYKRHIIYYYMAFKRHIPGSQQTHTRQSKGTYMAVNGYIRNSHTHIVHTWQLFVRTRGTELAIKRNRNW